MQIEQFSEAIPEDFLSHKVALNHGAHCVYKAKLHRENKKTIPVFYKKNKHGRPKASEFEVMSGELARLFMPPLTTPRTHLIKDNNPYHENILGVASESVKELINKRLRDEKANNAVWWNRQDLSNQKKFFDFKDEAPLGIERNYIMLGEATPDIFKQLLKWKEHRPQPFGKYPHYTKPNFNKATVEKYPVHIDYDSLAGILCTSLFLEEDDLHKLNIGFYITKTKHVKNDFKTGRYDVHFFKIDHDMMFYESLASKRKELTTRRFHFTRMHSRNFSITRRDLRRFPCVKDARMHYFPTQWRVFSKGRKAYKAFGGSRQAFESLSTNPEFIKAKWKQFLKCALMPPELVQASLHSKVTSAHPEFELFKSLTDSRIIQMQASLFSTQEFWDAYDEAWLDDIDAQLAAYSGRSDCSVKARMQEIKRYKDAYTTPLHVLVALNKYRYGETLQLLTPMRRYANTINRKYDLSAFELAISLNHTNAALGLMREVKHLRIRKRVFEEVAKHGNLKILKALLKYNRGWPFMTSPSDIAEIAKKHGHYYFAVTLMKNICKQSFIVKASLRNKTPEEKERTLTEKALTLTVNKKNEKFLKPYDKSSEDRAVLIKIMLKEDALGFSLYLTRISNLTAKYIDDIISDVDKVLKLQKPFSPEIMMIRFMLSLHQAEIDLKPHQAQSFYKKLQEELTKTTLKKFTAFMSLLYKIPINFKDVKRNNTLRKQVVTSLCNSPNRQYHLCAELLINGTPQKFKQSLQDFSKMHNDTFLLNVASFALRGMAKNQKHSLKRKKVMMLRVISIVIRSLQSTKSLLAFINFIERTPDLQLLSQLRTAYWCIRKKRGTHGMTSTSKAIYQLLIQRAEDLTPNLKNPDYCELKNRLAAQIKNIYDYWTPAAKVITIAGN